MFYYNYLNAALVDDFFGHQLKAFLVDVGKGKAGAVCGQLEGSCLADARRSA